MPTLSIAREDLAPQPILFVRRRGSRAELPDAHRRSARRRVRPRDAVRLRDRRPAVHALPRGSGAGLITIEAGCPLASPARGAGEVEAGFLQGGPAAVALHAGAYDELPATYAALERWLEESGYLPGGPPWESYLTDPADFPNPADWRTQVYWPLAR